MGYVKNETHYILTAESFIYNKKINLYTLVCVWLVFLVFKEANKKIVPY